jgi:hypothetical protein
MVRAVLASLHLLVLALPQGLPQVVVPGGPTIQREYDSIQPTLARSDDGPESCFIGRMSRMCCAPLRSDLGGLPGKELELPCAPAQVVSISASEKRQAGTSGLSADGTRVCRACVAFRWMPAQARVASRLLTRWLGPAQWELDWAVRIGTAPRTSLGPRQAQ